MKFIAFSDPHCSNYKAFTTYKDGVNSRLSSILSCIQKIQDLGKKEQVDFYLFAGDLFHTQGYVDSDVFNLTFDLFSKFDKSVVCVPGNHDNYGSEQPFNVSFQKFSNLPAVQILDYQNYKDIVYGVGYHKKYNMDLVQMYNSKILLMHDTPKGFNLNGYIFEDGVDWKSLEKYYDLILFGHIHQPKKMSEKTYVIGSPLEHSFADSSTNERGVWLYDNGKMTFIPLGFPKFIKADKLTEDIKKDTYNYYMVLDSKEQTEQGNVIVSKGITNIKIQDRLGQTTLSNEAVISKYIDISEGVEAKETYKKYGIEVLNKSSDEALIITPSNFILNKITIEGFLSFKNRTELEIKDGVWLVVGKGEVFSSNGSGKTSLFDSIFWGLYGKTTKSLLSDDVINDNINANCRVILELSNGADTLVIDRYRKYDKIGTGIVVTVNNTKVDGMSSMLDKKIISLLGYDYEFFLNTIYYSQEKTEFFSSSTDSTKKTFLDTILQLEKYSYALKSVRVDLTRIEKELDASVVFVKYIKEQIIDVEDNIIQYKQKSIVFEKERDAEVTNLKAQEVVLASELLEFELSCVDSELDITKYKDKYEKIRNSIEDLLKKEGNDIQELKSKLVESNSDMRSIEENKHKIEQNIVHVDNLKDGTYCKHCGGLITEDSRTKYITGEKAALLQLEQSFVMLYEQGAEISAEIESVEEAYRKEIQEYREARQKVYEKMSLLETGYKEQTVTRSNMEHSIRTLTDKISTKSKETNIFSLRVEDEIQSKLKKEEELKQKQDFCFNGNILKQMYEFWETGFSNKGIKSLLLDNFCNTFNKEIINNISLLSNGSMAVGLTNQTKLKSGDMSEKLSLKINILDKERSYEHLSGGEKRRVDIAVIITLNKIIRQMYNISNGLLGMLILDEVFSFLDDTGEENIFYLLKDIVKEIKSIFIITHTDELKSYFDNTIVVVKKDRNSYVEKS